MPPALQVYPPSQPDDLPSDRPAPLLVPVKPDCLDGWVQIASELHRAVNLAGFTKYARIVLGEVFLQTYSYRKLAYASLNQRELSRNISVDPTRICLGVRELCDSGVIVKVGPGCYEFDKHYSRWTAIEVDAAGNKSTVPRFTEKEVAFCQSAPDIVDTLSRDIPTFKQAAIPETIESPLDSPDPPSPPKSDLPSVRHSEPKRRRTAADDIFDRTRDAISGLDSWTPTPTPTPPLRGTDNG